MRITMKLRLTEGDRVVLAPFEQEPRQCATIEGVEDSVLTVRVDGPLAGGDDGLREITPDQVEWRTIDSTLKCLDCGSQDLVESNSTDFTGTRYTCQECGWVFTHQTP